MDQFSLPPRKALEVACTKWHITELALFGSSLRDDFNELSDVDVLVTFSPTHVPSIFELVEVEAEFGKVFQRKVDLLLKSSIQRSSNFIRREEILGSSKVIYAA